MGDFSKLLKSIYIRNLVEDDSEKIVDLIKKNYGNYYFEEEYYDTQYIKNKLRERHTYWKGAFLNDKKINHSGQKNLDRAFVTIGIPPSAYEKREKIMDALKNLILEVNSIRIFGAAALQLAEVAAGRIDGDIGFALSPWDVAAGWILVEEAGGVITDEMGGDNILEGTVVAGTPYVHEFLLDFVQNNVI